LVRRAEPLQLELSHFIGMICSDIAPLVTGEQGLAVMKLVWAIQDNIRKQRETKE